MHSTNKQFNISLVSFAQNFKTALSFDDVLLIPQYSQISSRSEVSLETNIADKIKLQIPLISINMDTVTGVEMAIKMGKLGGLGFLPRFDSPEIQADKVAKVKASGITVAAAIGIKNGYKERAEALIKAGASILTIDIAHGHMQAVLDATSYLKNSYPNTTIISGVIASYDGARNLFKAGADCVRVGIGPGSICTTRVVTGHGVPQVTAVMEAARAAREFKKYVLADGGTENSGDVVKALAAGASAVVIGSQFAGTDEAPGRIIEVAGTKYKEFNGSTSLKEKQRQMEKYGEDKDKTYESYVEGVEALVPYKGPVEQVVNRIVAGVKSGLSYSGAKNVEELWTKAEFVVVTQAGMKESRAHNVILN